MGVGQPDPVRDGPQVRPPQLLPVRRCSRHTEVVCVSRRWRPGQPDSWTGHEFGHGDEDCAHLHNDGRLNDLHCLTRLRFVCQMHRQHI